MINQAKIIRQEIDYTIIHILISNYVITFINRVTA